MRGKACFFQLGDVPTGITPAYAGKSRLVQRWNVFNQDHPRLCGEKFPAVEKATDFTGSPPPMRGKVGFGLFPNL